jgi:hypothetical protein
MTRRLLIGALLGFAIGGPLWAHEVRPGYLELRGISEEAYWDGHLELKCRRLMKFEQRNGDSEDQDLVAFAFSAAWRERMVSRKDREGRKG